MTAEAEKRILREEMLAERRALLPAARAEMTRALTEAVLSFPPYQKARKILAYLSLPGEADLDDVIRAALTEGKEIYIPVCLPGFRMEAGRLTDMTHFAKGPYGLRDLPKGFETISPEDLDLVLVPAVAVDGDGHRLGHGAGYYDRFLTSVSEKKRIAVVWDFQFRDSVPADRFDLPMGGIITEKRSIVF